MLPVSENDVPQAREACSPQAAAHAASTAGEASVLFDYISQETIRLPKVGSACAVTHTQDR